VIFFLPPSSGENQVFIVVYVYVVFLICFKTNHVHKLTILIISTVIL